MTSPDYPKMPIEHIQAALALAGATVNPDRVGHYASVASMVNLMCGSRCWSQGETFCHMANDHQWVVAQQIAPSSCEMMIITQNGFLDVVTAYRVDASALEHTILQHMNQAPGAVLAANPQDHEDPDASFAP